VVAEARASGWTWAPGRAAWPWRLLAWGAAAAVMASVLSPALRGAARGPYKDFEWHGESTGRTLESGRFETPHPLYQAMLLALSRLTGRTDWVRLGTRVALVFQLALLLLLAWVLERALPPGRAAPAWGALTAALLLVAAPVSFASWSAHNLYRGYLAVNALHNPTLLVLRPLAFAHAVLAARAVMGTSASGWGVAGMAALAVAGALAKPSYALPLLPALAAAWAWRAARGQAVDARALVGGAFLPLGLALAAQGLFAYARGEAALVWAPLRVLADFGASPARVVLSAVFPLTVAAVFARAARRDAVLVLAWAGFAAGLALASLLAESGNRATHGNLLWSAQVMLFLLFAASARFVLRQAGAPRPRNAARMAACGLSLALHLACGVYALRHPAWM
jgi:hypothetical protein